MVYAYVGNWNAPSGSQGIHAFEVDPKTGRMQHIQFVDVANPSFLAVSPTRKTLYAGSHSPYFEGSPGGGVSAYAIDAASGRLEHLNSRVIPVPHPAYVRLDRTDGVCLVACTMGGGVAALPIAADGGLCEASSIVMHAGRPLVPLGEKKIVNGGEPGACQPHSIMPSLDNQFAFAPDLRLNQVVVHRFDAATGRLEQASTVEAAPGSGPRHSMLHPDGSVLYVVNENGNTVSVYAIDRDNGALSNIQDISTLPPDFTGETKTADIHIDPAGRYLYASNRGHDSVAIYAVDPGTHQLRSVGYAPTLGKRPRGFSFVPDSQLMMVANQDSNNVVAFTVDAETGQLRPTGESTEVASPTCVAYLPA
jgi:6-phosphogluconolactonase